MGVLKMIEKFIVKCEEWFLVSLLLFMVFLAFFQVVMRNVFSSGIIWSDIVVRMGVLYIAIIGGSVATSDRAHIRIDLFNRIIPEKIACFLEIFIKIVACVCCVFFLSGSIKFVWVIKETGTMVNILQMPEWWFALIFPIGFLLMALKFFISFLDDVILKYRC